MRIAIKLLAFSIISSIGFSAAAEITTAQMPIAAKATNFISINRSLAGLSAKDVVRPSSVLTGPDGTQHVRYQRTIGGLPIIGGDFVVHIPVNGRERVTSPMMSAVRPASLTPRVQVSDAVSAAQKTLSTSLAGATSTSRLVMFARGMPIPVLAHEVIISGSNSDGPVATTSYIDAQSGKILLSFSNIQTQRALPVDSLYKPAVGLGITRHLGSVPLGTSTGPEGYRLVDQIRGNGQVRNARNRMGGMFAVDFTDVDNVWGNGTDADMVTAAADAHYGIGATWDYYKTVHGRNGIWGDGKGVTSYVNVGFNYSNAFWDGKSMYFGTGDGKNFTSLTALDVAGHEMSHGVVDASADLVYEGESGGLNEATADIFGTMVERYVYEKLGLQYGWTIGETIAGPELPMGSALRYMFKPSLDTYVRSDGEIIGSHDCYSDAISELDVHHSSGIGNRFFYLLSEGSVPPADYASELNLDDLVCNKTAVTGLGADAAQKIWYLALTAYFTSSTDYPAARVATLQAAADLYGQNSLQRNTVAAAWDAVLVP